MNKKQEVLIVYLDEETHAEQITTRISENKSELSQDDRIMMDKNLNA
jgi:hypothetical protein